MDVMLKNIDWFYILAISGRKLEARRKFFRQDSLDNNGFLIKNLRKFSLLRYVRLVALIRKLERKIKLLMAFTFGRYEMNRPFIIEIEPSWVPFYRYFEEQNMLTNEMIVLENYIKSKVVKAVRESRKKNAITIEQYVKLSCLTDMELFNNVFYDENGCKCQCIMYCVCDCC